MGHVGRRVIKWDPIFWGIHFDECMIILINFPYFRYNRALFVLVLK